MKIRLAGTIAALILAGVGGYWFYAKGTGDAPRRAEAPPVTVAVVPATTRDVTIKKRAIGLVESPAIVSVRSRIDSQILEQHVREGQFVKKDDLLFVLDDRDIRAQLARDEAILAKDQALLAKAQSDNARARELAARNVGTQVTVDQTTADAKAAAATVEADQATLAVDRLRLSYTRVLAPMAGRVGAVPVAPGNLVSAGSTTALTTITQITPIRVAFSLPERELPTLRALLAQVPPATVRATPSGTAPVAGELNFLDSAVDSPSGTISIKATFPNADQHLWPGQYVDVELDAGLLSGAVIIPSTAIQQGQSGPYVFVVGEDGKATMRQVTVAVVEGAQAAIAKGVAAGENIVVEGQARLREGSLTRVADATAGAKK
jgi:membrane fusion protein, multidrug efflux system